MRDQSRILHSYPWKWKSFNAYNYAHRGSNLYVYTQGSYTNHIVDSLCRIMVGATSVVGEIQMGNIVPRAGMESKLLHSGPMY